MRLKWVIAGTVRFRLCAPISFMDVEIKLRLSAVRKRPFCLATATNRPFMVDRNANCNGYFSASSLFSSGSFFRSVSPNRNVPLDVLRPTEGSLTSSIRRPEEDDG